MFRGHASARLDGPLHHWNAAISMSSPRYLWSEFKIIHDKFHHIKIIPVVTVQLIEDIHAQSATKNAASAYLNRFKTQIYFSSTRRALLPNLAQISLISGL